MIQVTCGACGATQDVADADIPPGSKTVTCSTCKSRVPLPGARSSPGLPDLPAPKRPSPLAGAGASKPPPKSPLADLPAPKAPSIPGIPSIPAIPSIPSISKPGGSATAIPDLPAPKQPVPDLPAPKPDAKIEVSSAPASARIQEANDLPAPKRAPPPVFNAPVEAPPDLVAPKRAPSPQPRPPGVAAQTTHGLAPTRAPGPPPKSAAARPAPPPAPGDIDLDDLLAPTARPGQPADLPSPVRKDADLVAPKRPSDTGLAPSTRSSARDVPDLPTPSKGATDLPAPKGFFDDLPQPARNQPQGSTDLPAPKGFFDDLPQPARNKPELPAPKGFFDDLPQRARNQSGLPQPLDGRAHTPSQPPPTADDLFDDLTPPPTMQTPPALDLDDLDLGPPGADAQRARNPSTSGMTGLSASMAGVSRAKSASLPPPIAAAPPPTAPPPFPGATSDAEGVPLLDLGDGAGPPPDFGQVDLPIAPPTAASGASGVSFRASKGSQPGGGIASRHEPMGLGPVASAELTLDVDETKAPPRRKRRTSIKAEKQPRPEATPRSKRRTLIALLALAALGGGGFFAYRWWTQRQAEEQRQAELAGQLVTARAALLAPDPAHWRTALINAAAVFGGDGHNAEAAGIAAQAAFASVFDDPTAGAETRQKQGVSILNRALGVPLSGPDLDKAQGLKAVLDGQPQRGLEKYLDPLVKRTPGDANAALYQGWARLAIGDATGAVEAFDRSAKALPKRDLPALTGRANAKLVLGDRAGAREDFTAVLGRDKANVAAQIGLAETAMTPAEVAQREKDLIALLNTKDIDKTDPRLVARGYTIIGDDARRGSRLDAARDRYRKAMTKAPTEADPIRGQAELELREGKLIDAAATIERARKLAPTNVDINLVAAEIALRAGKPDEADARLKELRDRKPVNPYHKARLFVLTGQWHESQNKLEDALAAYEDAMAVASPTDLETPLAIAARLGALAKANAGRADELRARATKLLAPIEAKADQTPSIAIALGVGYLGAGDPARAESWLRKAVAGAKDSDEIDARFQLAEALSQQKKTDEALAMLQSAFDRDDSRIDVGLQLALRYEEAGRGAEAALMYDKLLPNPAVTLDLRGRAGRFYARLGQIDKARAQGEEILKVEDDNPTGLYLRAVGLYADGKLEEARRALVGATEEDHTPQFLDMLGMVNEQLGYKTADPRYKDEALRAYTAASEGDPTLVSALAGIGRIQLERHVADKALEALLKANALKPKDDDIEMRIGLAYQLQQELEAAIAWLNRSLAQKPRPDIYYAVGKMQYDLDRMAPAAAALTKATELGETAERAGESLNWMTEAYYMLGAAQRDLGNDAATRHAWERYVARGPKDTVKVDSVRRALLGLRASPSEPKRDDRRRPRRRNR
jgi:tetratricopeptide (TPR) repeat protein